MRGRLAAEGYARCRCVGATRHAEKVRNFDHAFEVWRGVDCHEATDELAREKWWEWHLK